MGFFKDLHTVSKQSKEIGRTSDPGARLHEMNAKLAAVNASMVQQTVALAPDAVPCRVQVVSASPTGTIINGEPVMAVQVLVLGDGRPPVPTTVSVAIPSLQLHRLQPGALLAARTSPTDPTSFAFDWASA
ncbi:hypothetical protein KSP35_20915 [Aquihabitans sp. G128]|uniref:hypothetical protein n=1 Tax=Aquihabitans sp. G128 TaxID=2849779 RepID=UPI001C242ED0|nr:hypothetical protein [Aquihabitans sp. G128]QXC60754.1 hypothetical protein KSP35_20915 [Aquihabitans sp. G128]